MNQQQNAISSEKNNIRVNLKEDIFQLPQWIKGESINQSVSSQAQDPATQAQNTPSLLRRATVAYGIVELIRHVIKNNNLARPSTPEDLCSVENFAVRIIPHPSSGGSDEGLVLGINENGGDIDPGWEVVGVDMISPNLTLRIIAPSFSSNVFDEDDREQWGKDVDVEILLNNDNGRANPGFPCGQCEEMNFCQLAGNLLYGIFLPTESNFQINSTNLESDTKSNNSSTNERSTKKIFTNMSICSTENSMDDARTPSSHCIAQQFANVMPLTDLGCSSCVWALVKNLIDCGLGDFRPDESYPSLLSASQDIHRMLRYPERFLFNQHVGGIEEQENGKMPLKFSKNHLYGRESEISIITDAFCRVASSGESEVLFISGWSGSGKSSLAATAFVPVAVAGGYVVSKKFDEMSRHNQLPVILSAFDELCLLIKEQSSAQELHAIEAALAQTFGSNLRTLARILPSVVHIFSNQSDFLNCSQRSENEINFTGLCFTIQCFMRVISRKGRPIMIFIDDLHWGDELSISLVRSALTDIRKSSCFFFVGSYRNNEVQQDHFIFKLMDMLEFFNVKTTKLQLDGMREQDLNAMISDALSIFPRLCKTLTSVVFHKTMGNPLFALELLESLVQRDLIQYSYRERRYIWHENKIREEEVTDSVLHLLTTKLAALSSSRQDALKVVSCFGIQVSTLTIDLLCESENYRELKSELDEAVKDGFLECDKARARYKFVHDKVREAAASLVAVEERHYFHYDIGMSLLLDSPSSDANDMHLIGIDQINCGIPMIIEHPVRRVSVAELNLKASAKTMEGSNFMSAYSYASVGILLLPDDSWESHLALSVDLHFSLARAAYALGKIDEASETLKMLIEKIEKLEDKLHVYTLYIRTLHAKKDIALAFKTCLWVLNELGEQLPFEVGGEERKATYDKTRSMYANIPDSELQNTKENQSKNHIAIMKFYNQLSLIGVHATSREIRYFYIWRWAQLNLTNGFCKQTPNCLATFAITLANRDEDVREGYRIGKIALQMLRRFDVVAECAPYVYLCIFSYVAIMIDPFQSCTDMLQRGCQMAMAKGDIVMADFNNVQMVSKAMFGGIKLPILKKEIECQLKLASRSQVALPYWLIFQDTVSVLTGEREVLSPTLETELLAGKHVSALDYSQSLCHLRLVSSYWLGHYGRARYYAERRTAMTDKFEGGKFRYATSEFYFGLAGIATYRLKRKHIWIKKIKNAIAAMKDSTELSKWNFENKLLLLEADFFSALGKDEDAAMYYDNAINAAKASKFIHEQGLACELAGLHFSRLGDKMKALDYLGQAKECYHEWGSQMKVNVIESQLLTINK